MECSTLPLWESFATCIMYSHELACYAMLLFLFFFIFPDLELYITLYLVIG